MTPQEQELVNELFDRLAKLESNPCHPDAERLIAHLAASRPVSKFCHCYCPVPLFCVALGSPSIMALAARTVCGSSTISGTPRSPKSNQWTVLITRVSEKLANVSPRH
jgi:hypothetical protein